MTLAERLKEIRREHNFTQLDLAEVLGIDRTAYTYYEMGKTQPRQRSCGSSPESIT